MLSDASLIKTKFVPTDTAIEPEEETTDAGSSGYSSASDAESVGSSASEGEPRLLRRPAPPALRRSLGRRRGCFSGTPLEPIPGSPAAVALTPRELDNEASEIFSQVTGTAASPGDVLATVPENQVTTASEPAAQVFVYGPTLAHSPKKCARANMLARAKEEAVPLKISMPDHLSQPHKHLDPTVPAKKKPPYDEYACVTAAAMRGIKPGNPVKVRMPSFLLEDPLRTGPVPR